MRDSVSDTDNHDGVHIPVLLAEAMSGLAIKADGIYIDATFGRGGHSRALLSCLGEKGRLLALDRDPAAVVAGKSMVDQRFILRHAAFAELTTVAVDAGFVGVDGVLFDVGVSSPQIDEAARGFSFRHDAPLDMRMDTSSGETAADWLSRADVHEITEVLKNYGEERCAFKIAKKIIAVRREQALISTQQLASLIRSCVQTHEPKQDAATRSFQALRIHINQELQQLALALPQAFDLLKIGGRLVVIAFHSLEDRIVKTFMRQAAYPERDLPKKLPLRESDFSPSLLSIVGKACRASEKEVQANPRSRSAVLRVGEKLADRMALPAVGFSRQGVR